MTAAATMMMTIVTTTMTEWRCWWR
jgi:hypothetical protein